MKKRAGVLALAAAGFFCPAYAQAPERRGDEIVVADAGPAARLLPLEDVLAQLTRDFGLSFIFDSTLGRRTLIRSPRQDLPPNIGLDAELKRANLRLYTVKTDTYAIAAAAPAPAAAAPVGPAIVAAAAIAPDRIIVAASAAASLAMSVDRLAISGDDLALIGMTNTAEAVFDLPQSAASFAPANTVALGSAGGVSLADLRGLGHQRTLVLANGRRRAPTPGGNNNIGGVDLGSIPAAFIDRIEVYTHARGARLGEEAVAGAVNFSLREGVRGVEAGAAGGVSQRGDGAEVSLYALAGGDLATDLELTAGLAYVHESGLAGAARDATRLSPGFALDGVAAAPGVGALEPGFGGSSIIPDGSVTPAIIDANGVLFLPTPAGRGFLLNGDGGFRTYTGERRDFYNFGPLMDAVPPAERYFGMARLKWTPTDDFTAFFDATVSQSANNIAMAPIAGTIFGGGEPALGDGAVVPLDSPTVPDEFRSFIDEAYEGGANALLVTRRYVELGPRRQQIRRISADIVAGAGVALSDAADVGLSYRYGDVGVRAIERNRIDRDRLEIALDPARCAAAAGCQPIDFFRRGGISGAAADYIRAAPEERRISTREHELLLEARVEALPLLPAGAALEAGALYRRTHLNDATDRTRRILGAFVAPDVNAAIERAEIFLMVDTPADLGRFGEASLGFGARAGVQSGGADTAAFDADLEWSPIDGLALIMQNHHGGRAPNIFEAANIGQTVHLFQQDPCYDAPYSDIIAANCAAAGPLGVPDDFEFALSNSAYTYYGNPEARPERIRAWSLGVRLTPHDLMDLPRIALSIGAAWRRYRIEDYLEAPPNPLRDCYESAGLSSPSCGTNPATGALSIRRNPVTGRLIAVDGFVQNNGAALWEGADFDVRFLSRGGVPLVDRAWLTATHTLTAKVVRETSMETRLEGLVSFPRNQTWINAGVSKGALELGANITRRGRAETERDAIAEARLPPVVTVDLGARWAANDIVSIAASVENLTDRDAPVAVRGRAGVVQPEYYDIIGRRFTLAVEARF